MRRSLIAATLAAMLTAVGAAGASAAQPSLWQLYDQSLKGARYVDLTHTITPSIPVWAGFGPSQFAPSINPATGNPYTYKADGFEATRYTLATDQLGTQLDPPAHWAPEYAAIDELPATFAVRPLVVISIVPQVRKDFNYSLKVSDIRAWEIKHGTIPAGSVVFVRSDWSKRWPSPQLPKLKKFPRRLAARAGVPAPAAPHPLPRPRAAGHRLEPRRWSGESWLMHHGYAQAEGVANLDKVPPTGCLVDIGYPKFGGGVGGYARFVAICPPSWRYGSRIGQVPEAPLRKYATPLHWDTQTGMRVR